MILDDTRFKFIRTFGIFLLLIGIFGYMALVATWYEDDFYGVLKTVTVVVSTWHFVTGYGIVMRKKWGFAWMKLYLHVLFLGFPLGTIMAIKILNYIKANEIERFFSFEELKL